MKTLLLLAMLFLPIQAVAQTTIIPSAEAAVALALEKNPRLEVYQLHIQKAQQDQQTQQMGLLPQVAGTFGFQYNIDRQTTALPGEIIGQPGKTVHVQMGTKYIYNPGLSISKELLDYAHILKLRQAQIDVELKTVQAEAYKQKLAEQVLSYYYAALIAQQALVLNQSSIATSDSILRLSEEKFKQGIIDQASLHQARIHANQAQQQLLGNQMTLAQCRSQLKVLWTLPEQEEVVFTQQAAYQDLPAAVSIEADKNLLAYTMQARMSEIEVRLRKTAFLPKLNANAYFGYQQLSNTFGLGKGWNAYNYLGLQLNIPISTGFMNRGNLKAALMNHQINESIARLETLAAESKDQLLLVAYQNSLQQVSWAEANYQLFKQNEALALQKFTTGLTGLEPYFKAYQDRLQAENNYLTTLSSLFSHYSTIISR